MLVVLGEGYHRGTHASTLEGFDDPSLLSLHDGNARVCCTQVNTNNGPGYEREHHEQVSLKCTLNTYQ